MLAERDVRDLSLTFLGKCHPGDKELIQTLAEPNFVARLTGLFLDFRTGHGLVVFGDELLPLRKAVEGLLLSQTGKNFTVADDLFSMAYADEPVDYDASLWDVVYEAAAKENGQPFFLAVSGYHQSWVFSVEEFLEWWLETVADS